MSLSNRTSFGVGRVGAYAQAPPTVDQQVIRHVQELQAKTLRLQQEAYELVKETEALRETERQLSTDLDTIKSDVSSAGVRAADAQARNDVLIGSKDSLESILSNTRVIALRARQDISEREAHLKAVRKLYIETLDGCRHDMGTQAAATATTALESAMGRAMQSPSPASPSTSADQFAPKEAELAELRARARAFAEELGSATSRPAAAVPQALSLGNSIALPATPDELAFVLDPWGCAAGSPQASAHAHTAAAALSRLAARMGAGADSSGAAAPGGEVPELPELSAVSLLQYASFRLAHPTLVRDLLWRLDARLQSRFPLSAAGDGAAGGGDEGGENAERSNCNAGVLSDAAGTAPNKAQARAHTSTPERLLCAGEVPDEAGVVGACNLHPAEAFMSLAENAYNTAEEARMALSAALGTVLEAEAETGEAPATATEHKNAFVESDGEADEAATQIVTMMDDE